MIKLPNRKAVIMKFALVRNTVVLGLLAVVGFSSCSGPEKIDFPKTDLTKSAIIPKPMEVVADSSGFPLGYSTTIVATGEFADVGQLLESKIKAALGSPSEQIEGTKSVISFQKIASSTAEGYELSISNDSVLIKSASAVGAFMAVQTFRQLIPEISNDTLTNEPLWVIPTGTIKDAPQYAFRGAMLDVARHFFTVEDIKQYIDLLSYYKINKLHLHLTDDQGWRIEIKSWPKLSEVGGSTVVGGTPGGFYTQDDYKEIVAYAAKHFITVIPEVDMPGHTNAASVAYPQLNGNGKKVEPYSGMRVGFSTFDTRSEEVYGFIDDVVKEIAALTPGPYFHIGGDESHVTKKNDYLYFVNRVEEIVQKHGKQMVGWDEVANADLDESSVAQLWHDAGNGEKAAAKGMKVILSPAQWTYLDMKYDSTSIYGLTWAGYTPVDSAYLWSPESLLPSESVLGIEAPLWSETISNMDELEYLAFPRVISLAEVAWSTRENRNWEDHKARLIQHASYLEKMGVDYYRSPKIDWPE